MRAPGSCHRSPSNICADEASSPRRFIGTCVSINSARAGHKRSLRDIMSDILGKSHVYLGMFLKRLLNYMNENRSTSGEVRVIIFK